MKIKALAFILFATLVTPSLAAAQAPQQPPEPTPAPGTTDEPGMDDKAKAGEKKAAKLGKDEIATLAHVQHVNRMEIELGKLAQKQGTPAVMRYGEQLARDHSTSEKEVSALAKKRGIAKLPEEKPKTAAERQAKKQQKQAVAELAKLKGAEFDRQFLDMMIEDHEKELAKADVAIATVTDSELKTMLENNKVMLQRHADNARNIQEGTPQARAPVTPPSRSAK